jgi:hypothetical protein
MALDEAVHFFGRIVGDFLNIRVATLAFNFDVHALVKDVLVHVKQSKVAIFVDPAEAGILVTQ